MQRERRRTRALKTGRFPHMTRFIIIWSDRARRLVCPGFLPPAVVTSPVGLWRRCSLPCSCQIWSRVEENSGRVGGVIQDLVRTMWGGWLKSPAGRDFSARAEKRFTYTTRRCSQTCELTSHVVLHSKPSNHPWIIHSQLGYHVYT